MRILVAAVGRLTAGPEKDLYQRYTGRLPWPVTTREITEHRGGSMAERIRRDSTRLLAALPADATAVALDMRGSHLTSRQFAAKLGAWRDAGLADLAFLLGGADGLAATVRQHADLILSLGSMTWPHLMARVLLAEQLYRAHTILSGHPYHRR